MQLLKFFLILKNERNTMHPVLNALTTPLRLNLILNDLFPLAQLIDLRP